MAIPPFIAAMIEEMRVKKDTTSESQSIAAGNFIKSAMIMLSSDNGNSQIGHRQHIEENIECMRAAAVLKCQYIDRDWECDYDAEDRARAIIVRIARETTQCEEIARALKALLGYYSSRFQMEYISTDWGPVLLDAARTGDVILTKLATRPNAHVRDALAQALEIARDAGHEEICAIIRARIARYAEI
jgi:hypothetical protein